MFRIGMFLVLVCFAADAQAFNGCGGGFQSFNSFSSQQSFGGGHCGGFGGFGGGVNVNVNSFGSRSPRRGTSVRVRVRR